MARMYGAYARPRCPQCHSPSGPDCVGKARSKRKQRYREERQWRRDWADDVEYAQFERLDLETLALMIWRNWDGDARAYLDHYGYGSPVW